MGGILLTVRMMTIVHNFIDTMEHLAVLEIEALDIPSPSCFTEVQQTQEAFVAMVLRLADLKSYLPPALFSELPTRLSTERVPPHRARDCFMQLPDPDSPAGARDTAGAAAARSRGPLGPESGAGVEPESSGTTPPLTGGHDFHGVVPTSAVRELSSGVIDRPFSAQTSKSAQSYAPSRSAIDRECSPALSSRSARTRRPCRPPGARASVATACVHLCADPLLCGTAMQETCVPANAHVRS